MEIVGGATELWPIEKLRPHERNARNHTPHQIEQIMRSLSEYGWTFPVLVDEAGTIIAGHGRWMAGLKLKLAEVPVIVARNWTEEQKRAYMIADNKLAENAAWDEVQLARELADLREAGVDIDVIGFTEDELAKLFEKLESPDAPDDFPSFDEGLETEHACPKCGYRWSGGA